MPFEQNEKRIKSYRAKVEKGTMAKEEAEKKIAALQKKGKSYVARWTLANGREATKSGFKTAAAAAKYEVIQAERVRTGDAAAPNTLRAKVSEILAFYLEKIKDKGSFSSARKHCQVAEAEIGNVRLDRINANADQILNAYIFDVAPETYPNRKTLWNHKVYLSAAFAHWIKKKRLQMVNPWVVVDFPMPVSRRTSTPEFAAYAKILAEACKPGRPAWARLVFVLAWHHGRRGGEIYRMEWSEVHLKPAAEDLPWVRFVTLKQTGESFDEVPLFAEATEALRAWWVGQTEGRVFPLSRSGHDKTLREIMDAAGFPDLWLHDFRRAWNNRMRYLDQTTRMAFDGHKSEAMDEYYWTEKRKSLEAVVRESYALSGVNREQEF